VLQRIPAIGENTISLKDYPPPPAHRYATSAIPAMARTSPGQRSRIKPAATWTAWALPAARQALLVLTV
jgi:hypothetical protein